VIPKNAKETTMTHIYTLTASNMSAPRMASMLATLPSKYRVTEYGTDICDFNGQDTGSSRVSFYMMDATRANALRKWFQRRLKGRGKFARLVTKRVPVEQVAPAPAPEPTLFDTVAA
jgi:hypothetical protein